MNTIILLFSFFIFLKSVSTYYINENFNVENSIKLCRAQFEIYKDCEYSKVVDENIREEKCGNFITEKCQLYYKNGIDGIPSCRNITLNFKTELGSYIDLQSQLMNLHCSKRNNDSYCFPFNDTNFSFSESDIKKLCINTNCRDSLAEFLNVMENKNILNLYTVSERKVLEEKLKNMNNVKLELDSGKCNTIVINENIEDIEGDDFKHKNENNYRDINDSNIKMYYGEKKNSNNKEKFSKYSIFGGLTFMIIGISILIFSVRKRKIKKMNEVKENNTSV